MCVCVCVRVCVCVCIFVFTCFSFVHSFLFILAAPGYIYIYIYPPYTQEFNPQYTTPFFPLFNYIIVLLLMSIKLKKHDPITLFPYRHLFTSTRTFSTRNLLLHLSFSTRTYSTPTAKNGAIKQMVDLGLRAI